MRTRTLIRPTGTDPVTDYARQQVLKQDELQFFNSTTIKFQQKGRGITAHVINPTHAQPAKTSSQGQWFMITQRNGYNPGLISDDILFCDPVTSWVVDNVGGYDIPGGFGAGVMVAKSMIMRKSQPAWRVQGATYTLSNLTLPGVPGGADIDNTRDSIDSNQNVQAEFAYPEYLTNAEVLAYITFRGPPRNLFNLPSIAQCYIYAEQPLGGAGVPIIGATVSWQELAPARVWVAPSI